MKIKVNVKDLVDVTNEVSSALNFNDSIPLYNSIKLDAYDDCLKLSVLNDEGLFIENKIKASIEEEGTIIINGKLFNNYINLIKDGEILIESYTNKTSLLTSNQGKIKINSYEINNYPEFENYKEDKSFYIKECEFKKALENVIYSSKINDNRPNVKSLNLTLKDNNLKFLCIDLSRFAKYTIFNVDNNLTEDWNCLISILNVQTLIKIFKNTEENIKVIVSNNCIYFENKNLKIRLNLVNGKAFDEEKLMNKNNVNKIIVNKTEILNSLKRMMIISNDNTNNNQINLKIANNLIEIKSMNEKGAIEETINCKYSEEPIEIAFNCKYLFEAISKIEDDYLSIEIETNTKPINIKNTNLLNYEALILPLRIY